MDPISNIREQRELSAQILAIWDDCNADGTLTIAQLDLAAELAQRLAELVQALDEWQRNGGFRLDSILDSEGGN